MFGNAIFTSFFYLVCHSGDGALDDVAKGEFSLQVTKY